MIAAALSAGGCAGGALRAESARLTLRTLPSEVEVGGWRVRVSEPADVEVRQLGGSGGPILVFDVSRRSAHLDSLEAQAIRAEALARGAEPPSLAIWSKTGVSSWVRCEYTPRAGRYCLEQWEDHEPAGDSETLAPTGRVWISPSCDGSEPLTP